MRKQTKIAAVVSAAALLALGASMTSFAASKGTWMMVDGEWYCYDKNGDAYTNVFCSSNGKEYYVGDDGQLVRSEWVDYDGSYYFVNSSGAKITNDWRLTTPYDDDSADEEWYYFKSNGKRAENEKITYKGKSYYFDTDGKMLTGWVTTGDGTSSVNEANDYEKDHTFYCDETGARVEGAWVKDTEPGTDDDDADADEYWYYLKKATGKPATGKQSNINGQIYLFNEEGQMQYGWVARSDSSTKNFVQLDKEDEEQDMILLSEYADSEVYYCGDEDDGHAKKNKWLKTWLPSDTEEEEDDKEWFWFDKNGKLYRASGSDATVKAQKYKLEEGDLVYDGGSITGVEKKKVNSKDVVGNQSNKLYYYGMLIQADDYKYQLATIAKDGVDYSFIVNSNGTIQHSKSTEYKEDGDVLIATGIKNASGKATETKFVENGQFKYAISNEANNWDTVSKNVADIDMSGFVQGK